MCLMPTGRTLLCIHRDPAQLTFLRDHGYEVVMAANGHEGLDLFRSREVDAIVLEYHLGLLDGATVTDAIRECRPEVPIVMMADPVEFSGGALKSVDALVAGSDGPDLLLATVHFVLNAGRRAKSRLHPERSRLSAHGSLEDSFTAEMWDGIRRGEIRF